jgi:hypothetical protein
MTTPRTTPPSHHTTWTAPPHPSHQVPHQASHHPVAPPSHHPPEVTHRFVTPPPPQPSRQASHHPDRTTSHATPEIEEWNEPRGWRDRLADFFYGLRFVNDNLREQMRYVDACAAQRRGPWRVITIWFGRLIGKPGLIFHYFMAWAFFTEPGRALASLTVAIPLIVVLNGLPAVAWFIPDWADITTYF